jgi:hypothetical protein
LFALIYYYFYVFSPLLWTVGKWLAIPVLALSVLNELSYTWGKRKCSLFPLVCFAGLSS